MNAPLDDALLVPDLAATQSTQAADQSRNSVLASTIAKWHTLPQRDQRAVLTCSVVLLAVLLWQIGWDPAATAIPRLTRELPLDQSRLSKVRRESAEATRLQKLPNIARQAPEVLRESVAKSLEAASIVNADITVLGNALQVKIEKVSFHRWMKWQAHARTEFGVMVVNLDAKKVGSERGEVAINAELALPTP